MTWESLLPGSFYTRTDEVRVVCISASIMRMRYALDIIYRIADISIDDTGCWRRSFGHTQLARGRGGSGKGLAASSRIV